MAIQTALLNLVIPPACAGCGSEGGVLCSSCLAELTRRTSQPPGVPLGLPAVMPLPLVQLEWCAPFQGVTRKALHELKYAGERRLAEPLAEALVLRWRAAIAGGDLVTGVPVHPVRLKQRGYDQAQLLAAALSARARVPYVPALERCRATAPQFELGRAARRSNVAGAFGVRVSAARLVPGRWVVLVDDVVTTGSTLAACAAALYAAGAAAVSAITVARER